MDIGILIQLAAATLLVGGAVAGLARGLLLDSARDRIREEEYRK